MSYYLPKDLEFEMNVNTFGGVFITLPGDISQHYIDKHQRRLPHVESDIHHPAKVGDMVTLGAYLSKRLGVSVAFVSGVRTFRFSKNKRARQVEFLGLPCQWFSIGHVEEYKAIPDRSSYADTSWDLINFMGGKTIEVPEHGFDKS